MIDSLTVYAPTHKAILEGTDGLVPEKMPSMRDWLLYHYWDREGNPFKETDVPWVTAPNGPCDAADNISVNEIWLQWAARTFKTTFGQSLMQRQAHYNPSLMMFATRNENLCKQVVARHWEQLDWNPLFADEIPRGNARSATRLDFPRCIVRCTWAGSKSGLADEAAKVGHGNEIDKWEHTATSTEGDPLPRFTKRGAQFPDRKYVLESTPGMKGASRIESGRLRGTNCTYQVPCPYCSKFQEIVFGDGKEGPGIYWRKLSNGQHDIELARQTAYYRCEYCEKKILDKHRPRMSNLGVWVHEGCRVVDDQLALRARDLPRHEYPWMDIENAARNGNIWSSLLPVFHALFQGFGDMAAEFLTKKDKVTDLHEWLTECAGKTWSYKQQERKWRELYQRLMDPDRTPRWVCPSWSSMLTAAIDRQKDYYVWGVLAWGPGRRSHWVAYGDAPTLEEIRSAILTRSYDHVDGGEPLRLAWAMIDNSHRPDSAVEDFCINCVQHCGLEAWTCEGSETKLQSDYEEAVKKKGTTRPGLAYYRVDTARTQEWVDGVLHSSQAGFPGSGSICDGSEEEHQDLLEQLLNEHLAKGVTKTGHDRYSWERITQSVPNDYRDIWRYGYAGMLAATRNAKIRSRGDVDLSRNAVISLTPDPVNFW